MKTVLTQAPGHMDTLSLIAIEGLPGSFVLRIDSHHFDHPMTHRYQVITERKRLIDLRDTLTDCLQNNQGFP